MIQRIEIKDQSLKVIGSLAPFNGKLVGILCSQKCPGDLILKGFDTVLQLRDQNLVVVSGFHSPVEKDVFDILLRGNQSLVLCLAKSIESYRLPSALLSRVEKGSLTIIAPDFPISSDRITQETSRLRNALIIDICDQILVIHAHPRGQLINLLSTYEKNLSKMFALDSVNNQHLFDIGVQTWK